MTPTTSAVRSACDEERPSHNPCTWPGCPCDHDEMIGTLDALLANARAEGAAGEREHARAAIHEAHARYPHAADALVFVGAACLAGTVLPSDEDLAWAHAAIRAREAKEASRG